MKILHVLARGYIEHVKALTMAVKWAKVLISLAQLVQCMHQTLTVACQAARTNLCLWSGLRKPWVASMRLVLSRWKHG